MEDQGGHRMSYLRFGGQVFEYNKPSNNLHVGHEDEIKFGALDSKFGRYMKKK